MTVASLLEEHALAFARACSASVMGVKCQSRLHDTT